MDHDGHHAPRNGEERIAQCAKGPISNRYRGSAHQAFFFFFSRFSKGYDVFFSFFFFFFFLVFFSSFCFSSFPQSILFFLGILLSIDALDSAGVLEATAEWLNRNISSTETVATIVGAASAVIDNVPLVAATMGMYDLGNHPQDSTLWELVRPRRCLLRCFRCIPS